MQSARGRTQSPSAAKKRPQQEATLAMERATLDDLLSEETLPLETTEVRPPPAMPPPTSATPAAEEAKGIRTSKQTSGSKTVSSNNVASSKLKKNTKSASAKLSASSNAADGPKPQPVCKPSSVSKSKAAAATTKKQHQQQQRANKSNAGEDFEFTKSIDISMNNPGGDFDEMKLSPFYEGYETRTLLEKWRDLPSRLTINDWAYYIRTTRRRSQRTQVDRLVGDVCAKVLSMRELLQYSLDSGAHCLLWVNSGLARRFLPKMRRGSQILGRVQGDVIVKDKQNLASLLIEHRFTEWLEWPTHVCLNEKHEEIKRNNQRLCKHQYIGHYMGKCIDDDAPNCPNHEYYFCECFRKHFFVPEYFTFSHYYLMEEFLKKYETDMEFKKTVWLAKPAYLTGGKGFFLIRDAADFRYFYLVRSDTCVRREGYTLQRYLPRPCTLNKLKVDCRMYLMITVLNGRRVCGFFHPGFVRTAAVPWTLKFDQMHETKMSGNVFEHITAAELYKLNNARVPGESEEDDDEDKAQCFVFNEACEQIATGAKKVKKGEVENVLPFAGEDAESGKFSEKDFDKFHWRFKYMIDVLCAKLDPIVRDKPGTFQIFGLDILIDSDTKPWLLEVNSHVATEQIYDRNQCRVISNVVTEAICIVVELFQKAFEEEAIAMEIQQGEAPLAKLSRAQRLMTAKSEQDALDKLAGLLEMTEISNRKPPIFLQNFFWWYDTPRYRWIKPWVLPKRRRIQSVPWYSQTFINLIKRNEAIVRKNFKADEATANHDYMDYFRHVFWREKLEKEMETFEKDVLEKRAAKVRNPTSANNADAADDDSEASGRHNNTFSDFSDLRRRIRRQLQEEFP